MVEVTTAFPVVVNSVPVTPDEVIPVAVETVVDVVVIGVDVLVIIGVDVLVIIGVDVLVVIGVVVLVLIVVVVDVVVWHFILLLLMNKIMTMQKIWEYSLFSILSTKNYLFFP